MVLKGGESLPNARFYPRFWNHRIANRLILSPHLSPHLSLHRALFFFSRKIQLYKMGGHFKFCNRNDNHKNTLVLRRENSYICPSIGDLT